MDYQLKDKGVLVFASSEGLGRATATAFAKEGADVMLFARSEDKLKALQAELKKDPAVSGKIEYLAGDLTNAGDIQAAVDATAGRFGNLYTVINNTGGPPPGQLMKFSDEDWQFGFELVLLSCIRATRVAVSQMKKQGSGGRIINVASSSTKQVIDNLLMSNTFRTALVGFTKSTAREFGPDGILVNILGPGKIKTGRSDQVDANKAQAAGMPVEDLQKRNAAAIPIGRYGRPDEFAAPALFLGSPVNSYISGQSFLVDGAMVPAY